MTVVNLAPGAIFNVAANLIRRQCHVYRTGQGYDGFGSVASPSARLSPSQSTGRPA